MNITVINLQATTFITMGNWFAMLADKNGVTSNFISSILYKWNKSWTLHNMVSCTKFNYNLFTLSITVLV